MYLAGHNFSEEELVRGVILNLPRPTTQGSGTYLWAKLMTVFGFGSTVTYAMCKELGFDPDERVCK